MNSINLSTSRIAKTSLAIIVPLLLVAAWAYSIVLTQIMESSETEVLGATTVIGPSAQEKSAFTKALKPIYSDPKELIVPSLGLDLFVENVGVEEDGTLATPKGWDNVGWYRYGAHPGEPKNMIINGHYDNNFGNPAAFWKLKGINVGDVVEVKDGYGRIFTYKVLESFYVDINDPSRLKVLDDIEETSTLTLITCGGVWQYGVGYSQRLVVKAELTETSGIKS